MKCTSLEKQRKEIKKMSKGLQVLYCDHDLIKRHIAEALVFSAFPMSTEMDTFESLCKEIDRVHELIKEGRLNEYKRYKRVKGMGSAKHGSGHDCWAKGVIVNAVISAPSYWYPQMQRYHFLDIISSQSKMHRITKMDLETQCIDEVDQRAIDLLNEMIDIYNNVSEEHKEDAFRKVLANCPMGLKLTCAITTNYLQLKGIRNQRKGHKLSEWRVDFMEWLDSLPYFKELTGEDNEL